MKVGIILIFEDNETLIDINSFMGRNEFPKFLEICMVDNSSKDNTLGKIKIIKSFYNNKAVIVQIKKRVSEKIAKRAGARYLRNKFNLEQIGFVTISKYCKTKTDFEKLLLNLQSIKDVIPNISLKLEKVEHSKSEMVELTFPIDECYDTE